MKAYEIRLSGFTSASSARELQPSIEMVLDHDIPSSFTVVGAERDFTLVLALCTGRRAAEDIAGWLRAHLRHPVELVESDLDRHPDLREQYRSTRLQTINSVFGGTTGPVFQVGVIRGDVTLRTHDDPARHEVPIIVSVRHHAGGELLVGDDVLTPMPSEHTINVLVEGRSAQAVILHALRPVVLARRAPRPGYLEPEPPAGAFPSAVQPRYFEVFLSAPPRLASDLVRGPGFPFKVTSSDPEIFELASAEPVSAEVDWRLELDWTCAGRSGTVTIDADGRPFQTYPARLRHFGPLPQHVRDHMCDGARSDETRRFLLHTFGQMDLHARNDPALHARKTRLNNGVRSLASLDPESEEYRRVIAGIERQTEELRDYLGTGSAWQ